MVEAVNSAGQEGLLGGLRVDIVRFWPESRTMASRRYRRAARIATQHATQAIQPHPASVSSPERGIVVPGLGSLGRKSSTSDSSTSDSSSSGYSSGEEAPKGATSSPLRAPLGTTAVRTPATSHRSRAHSASATMFAALEHERDSGIEDTGLRVNVDQVPAGVVSACLCA